MIGFTSSSRVGDRDMNICLKTITDGKCQEVRGDVMVLKETGRGEGMYKTATMYDVAPIKRYFTLYGNVPREFIYISYCRVDP